MDHFVVQMGGTTNELIKVSTDRYVQKIDEAYSEAIPDRDNNRWTLKTRDGMTFTFGEAGAARSETGSPGFDTTGSGTCNFTTAWHLTSIQDPNGNSVRISYSNYGQTPVVAQILYGGNELAGIAHPYKVTIDTENLETLNRPLVREVRSGADQVISRRIQLIKVLVLNPAGEPQQIRQYNLTYKDDPRTADFLLESIAGSDLPKQSFEYATSTPNVTVETSQVIPAPQVIARQRGQGPTIGLFDLNGDGLLDRLCSRASDDWSASYAERLNVSFSLGEPCNSNSGNWNVPSINLTTANITRTYSPSNNPQEYDSYQSIDINGDGVLDLVRRRQDSIDVYAGACTSPSQCGFSPTREVWDNPGSEPLQVRQNSVLSNTLIDMDGDGLPDIVREAGDGVPPLTNSAHPVPNTEWKIFYNNGASFDSEPVVWENADHYLETSGDNPLRDLAVQRELFDVNGDGLPDLVSASHHRNDEDKTYYNLDDPRDRIPDVYFTVSTEGEIVGPYFIDNVPAGPISSRNNSSGAILSNPSALPANGAIVPAISVRLNNGRGFSTPVYSPAPFWKDQSNQHLLVGSSDLLRVPDVQGQRTKFTRDFVDVNGDGRVDWVATGEDYNLSGSPDWFVLYNMGGGRFGAPLHVEQAAHATNNSVFLGEVRPTSILPGMGSYISELYRHTEPGDQVDTRESVFDIDGDGIPEKVTTSNDPGGAGPWHLKRLKFITTSDVYEHTKPNLLIRMHDGVGGRTEFQYKPASTFAGIAPDSSAGFVGGGVPFPLWVVTGVRHTDGLCAVQPVPAKWFTSSSTVADGNPCLISGNDIVQKIDYAKGAFDGPDRDFRGFGEVTVSNAPLGIGAVRKQWYYQDDFRKGRVKTERIYAGGVDLVSEVEFDWQSVTSPSGRTQVYLREQRTRIPATGSSLVAGPSEQCVVQRNSIFPSGSSADAPDPQTRVSTTCTMSCTGADASGGDLCSPDPVGKKQTSILYAEPAENGEHRIYDQPFSVSKYYARVAGSLELSSQQAFSYDGLGAGQIDRGRLTTMATRLSSSPDEWQTTTYLYDTDSSQPHGPGNKTSVSVVSTRDPHTFGYDPDFRLFQTEETRPRTFSSGSGLETVHQISRKFDPRTGKVVEQTGVLRASAGDLSGATYDTLGRPLCQFEPGTTCLGSNTGARHYSYFFGDPTASSLANRLSRVEMRSRAPGGPNGYLTTKTYFDALGRERFATREQLNAANTAITTVVVRHLEYGENGKEARRYEPYYLSGALGSSVPVGTSFTQTSYVINGNSSGRLDPFGRAFQVLQSTDTGPATLRFTPQKKYFGNTVESVSPTGDVSHERSDEHGRVVFRATFSQASQSVLTQTEMMYDGNDNLVEEKFGGNNNTKISKVYDLGGRPITTVDPDSGTWVRKYDRLGNLIYVDDPKPNQSVQSCYDEHDRVVLQCARSSDAYDSSVCSTRVCDKKYTYTYDETANIVGQTNLGKGRLTSVIGPSSTHRFLYDVRGRVISQQDTVAGVTGTTSFTYLSDVDRLTETKYPDGERVVQSYNIAGQPISLWTTSNSSVWLNSYILDAKYDVRGRLIELVHENQTVDYSEFHGPDQNFRLKRLQSVNNSAVPYGAPSAPFLDIRFDEYDENGRVTSISDQMFGSGVMSMSGTYAYDGAGRLLSADVIGQKLATGQGAETFSYDLIGNMTTKSGRTFTYGNSSKPHRATALSGTLSTAAGMSYDENGQQTVKSNADGSLAYVRAFDPFGNMTRIDILNNIGINTGDPTVMAYDHFGQRVYEQQGNVTRRYFGKYSESKSDSQLLVKYYYFGDRLVSTRSDSAPQLSGAAAPLASPISVPPELYWALMCGAVVLLVIPIGGRSRGWIMSPRPAGAVGAALVIVASALPTAFSVGCVGAAPIRHYHLGHLGGPLAITGFSGGAVEYQYRYSAYGEVRRYDANGVPKALDSESRREYAGYQTHNDSGLQYAGARYYDPALAQFLSHDPAGEFPSPYAYVGWNPMNLADPSGRQAQVPEQSVPEGDPFASINAFLASQPATNFVELRDERDGGVFLFKIGVRGRSVGKIAPPLQQFQTERPDLGRIGNSVRDRVESSIEKDLFEHYWLGSATDVNLTADQFGRVEKAVSNLKQVREEAIPLGDDVLIRKEFSFPAGEFDAAFGNASVFFSPEGRAVGFYDRYNFDIRWRGSLEPTGKVMGVRAACNLAGNCVPFDVTYGQYVKPK